MALVAERGVVFERVVEDRAQLEEHFEAIEALKQAQMALKEALPDWECEYDLDGQRGVYRLRARPPQKFTDPERMGAYFVGVLAGLFGEPTQIRR